MTAWEFFHRRRRLEVFRCTEYDAAIAVGDRGESGALIVMLLSAFSYGGFSGVL